MKLIIDTEKKLIKVDNWKGSSALIKAICDILTGLTDPYEKWEIHSQ